MYINKQIHIYQMLENILRQRERGLKPMVLSIALHIAIILYAFFKGFGGIEIVPQSLNVSFVAVSSSSNFIQKAKTADIGQKISKTNETTQNKKSTQNVKTSGIENNSSQNLNSAISEPIFNAEYLNNPSPIYPESAKRDGVQGRVILLVNVSSDGLPKNVTIVSSSGFSVLDKSAKSAISSWKFIPAKQYGKTIDASVLVPIEFKLS